MDQINSQIWKQELPAFKEKADAFFAGELDKNAYKGFSGYYGSYAQRGGAASMLRLRMPAGRVTAQKLRFVADAVRRHQVELAHFTTCQTIQLHNLSPRQLYALLEEALDTGIVPMGGGGDFPRNVMCSPLSGVDPEEYFDVLPYAEAASDYLLTFLHEKKMPRKLKVCFSHSPKNLPHATYRDLGFAAREDQTFDVYSAGGLGNNPRMGVKVAEKVKPEEILYYIKAMWLTFCAYGNYTNRGKARTRYMQETLGGAEEYKKAFLEKLQEVYDSGENLTLSVSASPCSKKGDGSQVSHPRAFPQKQEGLYTVLWHPMGGQPELPTLCALGDLLTDFADAELRLAPDQSAYIVNLTGQEAQQVLKLTQTDTAQSLFETSVSCIGSGICQVGARDSQALLAACVKALRDAELPDGVLPQIHISGCPSSCGTHQTGRIGFRGGAKSVDGKAQPAFLLYVNGCELQGKEQFGRSVGTLLEKDIPDFLVKLGKTVAASGLDYEAWSQENPDGIDQIAESYL